MRGGFSFQANNARSNVRSDRGNQSEAKLVTHTTQGRRYRGVPWRNTP